MKKSSLSVIITTYNGAKYLNRQLDSVVSQTYPIREIIILDDCSSDNTLQIIRDYEKRYSEVKVIQNQNNLGAIKSFQEALKFTTCDYIAFCDQDDIWEKKKIEKQLHLINDEEHDDNIPTLLFHDLALIDADDNLISNSFLKTSGITKKFFSFKSIIFSNVVTGCSCIINKKMKEYFLEVDTKRIMMHDHWFALIAFSFGQYFYVDETLLRYRRHSTSVTPKNSITGLFRFKNFVKNYFSSNSFYLEKNILQAEYFKSLYSEKLVADQIKFLDKFINLKNKIHFIKLARPYFRFLIFFEGRNSKR